MNEYPTSHHVRYKKVMVDSPLADLINICLDMPSMKRLAFLANVLEQFHLKGTVTMAVQGRKVEIDKKEVINFGSFNYLGFDQHPSVIEGAIRGIKEFGGHAGCSRYFTNHANIIRLEEDISQLVGAEKTVVCANISHIHHGVVPTLFGRSDVTIFLDRFAHMTMYQSSLIAKAKGATLVKCNISHLSDLEKLLMNCRSVVKVLMIDGVYSMQGNLPPIPAIQSICDRHRCVLYVDDAHGIGVFGENGGGVSEHFGLKFKNMILTGSLQKGLGTFGGFVSGMGWLIDYVRANATSYIFSGAIQPLAVEGARAAIALCRSEEGRKARARLREKSHYIRQQLKTMKFDVPDGESPIIPIPIGGDLRTLMAGRKMFDDGVFLNSVLFPAVPPKEGILRISLNANHTDEDIEALLNACQKLWKFLDEHKGWSSNVYFAKEILVANVRGEKYTGLS